MIRILEVGLSYNPGGVESFIMNYYRWLINYDFQFDFICMYDSLAYQEEILALGGNIYYLPNVKRNPIQFRKKFLEVLERGKYKTVHVNMLSAANILPLKVAADYGVPQIIAHSHNTRAPGILRNIMHRMNIRKIDKYATDRWACSTDAAYWLYGKVQGKAAVVMNNAIDTKLFSYSEEKRRRIRTELNISTEFVLGHVGRMEEQKNHEFLLRIMSEVVKIKKDAVLLLIGDGERKGKLIDIAKDLGILEHIKFLGLRKDVFDILSAMDVFVFPSLYEGLSVTAVEAQCANLPCYVSDELTEDTAICDNFIRISLQESPKTWAKKILDVNINLRSESDNDRISKKMEGAGFSIETEIKHFISRIEKL